MVILGEWVFLMSEVPLQEGPVWVHSCGNCAWGTVNPEHGMTLHSCCAFSEDFTGATCEQRHAPLLLHVDLCLGPYVGPRGRAFSYERGTPVRARTALRVVLCYYRGTLLIIRNRHPVGPYSRTMPRLLWRPWGGGRFLMSGVPL